jgi:flagellar biosynthesis regulator FlaF
MFLRGVPPPVFWAQNPCFLEVTGRVALQNIENKEVPCKIFLAKELRAVLASPSLFRLKSCAKKRHRDDDLKEDFWNHCA